MTTCTRTHRCTLRHSIFCIRTNLEDPWGQRDEACIADIPSTLMERHDRLQLEPHISNDLHQLCKESTHEVIRPLHQYNSNDLHQLCTPRTHEVVRPLHHLRSALDLQSTHAGSQQNWSMNDVQCNRGGGEEGASAIFSRLSHKTSARFQRSLSIIRKMPSCPDQSYLNCHLYVSP